MNEKEIQQCRTCLKDSTKTYPLTTPVQGCTPNVTYGQFLKEYAQIEYNADYEFHMPQYLCFLCCRQIDNTYVFIRQAQNSNQELINVITKQIDCLREQVIDLPEIQEQTLIFIKTENINNVAVIEDSDSQDFITIKEENLEANITLMGDLITERIEQEKHDIEENLEEDNRTFNIETNKNTTLSPSIEASTILNKSDDPQTTESLLEEMQYPTCNKLITKHDNLINQSNQLISIHHDVTNIAPSKNQTFACKKCPCKYNNKYKYLNHVKDKHGSKEVTNAMDNNIEKPKKKVVKCRSCDHTANSYAALNYHTRSKHGTESDKLKCNFCSYASFKKYNLLVHVKKAHMEIIKTLKSDTKSKKTEESISSNNNLNNDNCATSDSLITPLDEENSLDRVEYSSEDDIPLARTMTQSGSKYSSEVEQEKGEFSDEDFIKDFLNIKKRQSKGMSTKALARRCNECGNIYKNSKSLRAHKCSARISSKEVTNAMDSSKEKPKNKVVKCRSCDYTAKSYAALNYHNRSKHGTESDKLKCKFCSYTSWKKANLLIHVKNAHKELIKTLKAETNNKTDESISSNNNLNNDNCTTSDSLITPLDEENSLDREGQSSEDDIPLAHTMNQSNSKSSSNVEKEEFSDEDFIRDILNIEKRQKRHKGLSTKSLARRCNDCGNIYKNSKSLSAHKRSVHISSKEVTNAMDSSIQKPKNKVIKCQTCDYTAKSYAALNYHNRSKHGTESDKLKCNFCSYTNLKKCNLLGHVKNAHKELIKTLKAETNNKTDESISTNNNLNNDNCTPSDSLITTLDKENSLNREGQSSEDDIPLAHTRNQSNSKCSSKIEKEEFSDEDFIRDILNIKKRRRKGLSAKSLARRCNECGNIYKNYTSLSVHKRSVHISEDKFSLCPHCGKKYKRKTDLRIHMEKAHAATKDAESAKKPTIPKAREKRFMCTECSYVCETITILTIHRNRHHTGEKPHKCDICNKSFIVPYDLRIHRYLHTGERPYKCPVCGKGFRDSSHMLKHKRIHFNERPYKCNDCGKSFTQSYNLSVHKRTHLKEKKLDCSVCGKLFENKSMLNIHRINENHHDEVL